jgi:hypothetical protein
MYISVYIYDRAWKGLPSYFVEHACMDGYNLRTLENAGIPIVVGEWSLATGRYVCMSIRIYVQTHMCCQITKRYMHYLIYNTYIYIPIINKHIYR